MSRNSRFATIVTLPIVAFVNNTASAQAANYHPDQSVGRLKANVPSALSRFHRGRLPNVYGEAARAPMGAWHQRTLSQTDFITKDRNLEGYPRSAY
jgi:hypothetical protein